MPMDRRDAYAMILSRLTVEIVRSSIDIFFEGDRSASAIDVLICSGLFVGQAEGRLMTAGKLAEFVGVPRTTILRRLDALKERGIISGPVEKRWSMSDDSSRVHARRAATDALMRHFRKATAEVSKVDSEHVERRKMHT